VLVLLLCWWSLFGPPVGGLLRWPRLAACPIVASSTACSGVAPTFLYDLLWPPRRVQGVSRLQVKHAPRAQQVQLSGLQRGFCQRHNAHLPLLLLFLWHCCGGCDLVSR
jgi:hypothetical protein